MKNNEILHKVDNNKEILINKMYVGRYLNDNIGHEVINLIKSDNGQNYIYVNPYGSMDKKHNNKIDTILLVRNSNIKDTFEILAQAYDLEQVNFSQRKNKDREKQLEYIYENSIKYNDKYVNKIFYENEKNEEAIYISFRANKIKRPKKPIYISFLPTTQKDICDKDSKYILIYLNSCKQQNNTNKTNIVNIAKQSLKMYIGNKEIKYNNKIVDQSKVFEKLKYIIENSDYWKKENSTKKVKEIIQEYENGTDINHFNIIDIIDKNYDEVIFSNMFKYIFSANPKAFCSFANTVLKNNFKNNKLNLSEQFNIEREKGHTDLLITDKINKNIIVIENKIKSGINGKDLFLEDKKVKGQLYEYYRYANREIFEYYKNKFFYIFVPDYSYISETDLYPKSTYKIIKYSQIYDFFYKYRKSFENVLYFKEFLYALQKHISNTDNILEQTTHKRFIESIKSKN